MASSESVALVVNCQLPRSYANRRVLAELYGGRFPRLAFCVGPDAEPDPDFPTVASRWRPGRFLHHQCGACPPGFWRHPAGVHLLHPRLVAIAGSGVIDDADWLLFVEDDCLIGPHVTPATLAAQGGDAEAVLPPLWFCDRDDDSWLWPAHPTGYAAFAEAGVSDRIDRDRLLAHWEAYARTPTPPVLYTPLFGGFVDWILIRPALLRRLVPDLTAMAEVWHELAIPTAVLHHTHRIGVSNGLALWGRARHQPLGHLLALLPGRDFVHAIKPGLYDAEGLIAGYRALAAAPEAPRAAVVPAGPHPDDPRQRGAIPQSRR